VQITSRALTFGGEVYNLNTHFSTPLVLPTNYYGIRVKNEADLNVFDEEQSANTEDEVDTDDRWHITSA
jgi:hypothetical protein